MATRRKKVPVVEEPKSTCETCKHSFVVAEGVVVCRRYPPDSVYDTDAHDLLFPFPQVTLDTTCGEYSRILNS